MWKLKKHFLATLQHMLSVQRVEETAVTLSLAFAIVHGDLTHVSLSLLLHTLPNLLLSADSYTSLTDPRGLTLAKFCVLTITAAHTARSTQKETNRGRKRPRNEFDLDDMDDLEGRQMKRAKIEPQITLDSEGFNFGEWHYIIHFQLRLLLIERVLIPENKHLLISLLLICFLFSNLII